MSLYKYQMQYFCLEETVTVCEHDCYVCDQKLIVGRQSGNMYKEFLYCFFCYKFSPVLSVSYVCQNIEKTVLTGTVDSCL